MIKINPLQKYAWLWQAIRESMAQPWGRKFRHLRYRLLWEIRPRLRWPGAVPLAVDIELASVCNFKCTMCQQATGWYDEWHRLGKVKAYVSWETFTSVVDECAEMGVYSMKVNWRGEPMLNPHLVEAIRYIKHKGIHEVMMNTNASKLTPELADEIIGSGLDRIIFSCDGISRETYNTIRVGGDWDKFIANIRMFAQRCRAQKLLGRRVPVVRLNASIQEANRHEIPEFENMFNGLVDELRFNTIYSPQSKLSEKRQVKKKGCPQIYQRMIVSTEGDAVPCCADYLKELKLGNLKDTSLKKMYQFEMEKIRIMHEIHKGRDLDGCKKCDLFALSEKNAEGEVIWA